MNPLSRNPGSAPVATRKHFHTRVTQTVHFNYSKFRPVHKISVRIALASSLYAESQETSHEIARANTSENVKCRIHSYSLIKIYETSYCI